MTACSVFIETVSRGDRRLAWGNVFSSTVHLGVWRRLGKIFAGRKRGGVVFGDSWQHVHRQKSAEGFVTALSTFWWL